MAKSKREIITGVEIGTSTVKVVMGEFLPDDVLAIVGVGEAPSLRVAKGEIEDVDVVGEQLKRAVDMAEKSSGIEIDGDVFLAVTGAHIQTVNGHGTTVVQSADHRIDEDAVIQATQAARGYTLPPDRETLHTTERGYRIDDIREVANALGQVGAKLEAEVQIVYGQSNRLETNCHLLADVMGYPATDIAFSGVAAAFAAFGHEPQERVELLLDIGAGVTEYAVFCANGCYHCGQLTVGCDHLANDLAIGLRLQLPTARAILRDMATLKCSAVMEPDGRGRLMSLEDVGKKTRKIPRSSVEEIVELRLEELFTVIRDRLEKEDVYERITAVKLCGGGALIPDVDRLANRVFRRPVATASPQLLSGKKEILQSPRFLTPIGLIRWGKLILEIEEEKAEEGAPEKTMMRALRATMRMVRDALHW